MNLMAHLELNSPQKLYYILSRKSSVCKKLAGPNQVSLIYVVSLEAAAQLSEYCRRKEYILASTDCRTSRKLFYFVIRIVHLPKVLVLPIYLLYI
jgi:hypothetical protein